MPKIHQGPSGEERGRTSLQFNVSMRTLWRSKGTLEHGPWKSTEKALPGNLCF